MSSSEKLIVPTPPADMREQARRYGLDIPSTLIPQLAAIQREARAQEAVEPDPKPHRASKAVRSKRRARKLARKANR